MALQPRISNRRHLLRLVQKPSNLHCVPTVYIHPQRKGLNPTQGEETIEGAGNDADGVLREPQPLMYILTRGHHHATYDVAVTPEVLRSAVYDHINPNLQGPLQIRRGEGVVHDRHDARLLPQAP